MKTSQSPTITISVTINAPREKVWEWWTKPAHITQWNFAHPSWHCPAAINDLHPGGAMSWRMEARDGSAGFNFGGTYETIKPEQEIHCRLDDGRKWHIMFEVSQGATMVTETFEIEDQHSGEQQRQGWQAILNQFKHYVESDQNKST